VIVTASRRWHPGVVGLIASRLKDRFHRPAIAIAFQPSGLGSGSGRSIAGVDLGHAIRAAVARGLLVKGGGHALAAGLTIEEGRLGELRAYLEEALGGSVQDSGEADGLPIDAALSARGATIEMIDMIGRAGPFGTAHPEPIFVLPSHRIAYAEAVGNGHIRLTLATSDGATIKAMAFRAADAPLGQALITSRGQFLHVAGTLVVDQWQGRRQPVVRVIDAAVPVA
jgi:single-stranded-DNA-specific exonuclease